EKPMDKLGYYDRARQDSVRFLEMMKNDPHFGEMAFSDTEDYLPDDMEDNYDIPVGRRGLNTSLYGGGSGDPNADRIYRRLAGLDREMNRPVSGREADPYGYAGSRNNGAGINPADGDRLEQMMQRMGQPGGEDPEMQQINGMLEKILDVQHPERVQEKLRQVSESRKGQVFAVSAKSHETPVSMLDNAQEQPAASNGFFSLDEMTAVADTQNAVQAV